MAVEILVDIQTGKACFACNTSDTAFGPLFANEYEADDFLTWVTAHHGDPRDIKEYDLLKHYQGWQELQEDSDVRVYGAGGGA